MRNEPFKFTTCCICGKQYIKLPGTIYHVNFAGRECQCCGYDCYNIANKVKHEANNAQYSKFMAEAKGDNK